VRRFTRIIAVAGALVALVALTGCRVDVTTSLQLDSSGAGVVTVDVIADAEVIERVPDLATQLRLDDLTASGWQTDGPTPTNDGGLQVTLVHPVTGPEEANQVLAELNGPRGPYRNLVVRRTIDDTAVITSLTGALGMRGGDLAGLADENLQALLPEVPLADLFTNDNGEPLQVADVFGARLVVGLPDGDGDATAVTVNNDGATAAQVFTLPADGTKVTVDVQSVVTASSGMRAPVVAAIALVALVAWLIVSIAFVRYVLRHRNAAAAATRASV
jgi:hypothetical protein